MTTPYIIRIRPQLHFRATQDCLDRVMTLFVMVPNTPINIVALNVTSHRVRGYLDVRMIIGPPDANDDPYASQFRMARYILSKLRIQNQSKPVLQLLNDSPGKNEPGITRTFYSPLQKSVTVRSVYYGESIPGIPLSTIFEVKRSHLGRAKQILEYPQNTEF